jgi:hypothetical protein
MMAGGLLSTPVFSKFDRWISKSQGLPRVAVDLLLMALFGLSLAFILSNDFQPFLYARF